MYNQPEIRTDHLYQFMEKFNFATLVSHENGEFFVSHIPVILERGQGSHGTLVGHMAKTNPHLKVFDSKNNSTCIFHGPHSYISPTWYKSSPNVPTWNYAVVHVYGKPIIVSKEQLSEDLAKMLSYHESIVDKNSNYIIPDDYKNRLMEHIVGFRIEILRIENRFKLGQHKNFKDQEGVLNGLRKQNSYESLSLSDFYESFFRE